MQKSCLYFRTTDRAVADMLLDFLIATGISRNLIKCSSLPDNDVIEKIPSEVRSWIEQSTVNIAILSDEYYKMNFVSDKINSKKMKTDLKLMMFVLMAIMK